MKSAPLKQKTPIFLIVPPNSVLRQYKKCTLVHAHSPIAKAPSARIEPKKTVPLNFSMVEALFPVADGEAAEPVPVTVLEEVVSDPDDEAVSDPDDEEATEPAGIVERAASVVNAAVSPVTFVQADGTVGFEPLLKFTAAHYILLDKHSQNA